MNKPNTNKPSRAIPDPNELKKMLQEEAGRVSLIPLEIIEIIPNFNPRTALLLDEDLFSEEALANLISSIKAQGVLQPILLRPKGKRYEVIAGERRFHASKFAGLSEIPAMVLELDDEQARLAALTENGQRANIPYATETMMGLRDIATMTGVELSEVGPLLNRLRNELVSDTWGVIDYLRQTYDESLTTWTQSRLSVLKFSKNELEALNAGKVKLNVIKPLIKLGDRHPETRANLLAEIITRGITAREVGQRVRDIMDDSSLYVKEPPLYFMGVVWLQKQRGASPEHIKEQYMKIGNVPKFSMEARVRSLLKQGAVPIDKFNEEDRKHAEKLIKKVDDLIDEIAYYMSGAKDKIAIRDGRVPPPAPEDDPENNLK